MTEREQFHLHGDGERGFGYAQAVRIGDTVHIAGTMAVNDAMEVIHPGNVAAQMAVVYDDLGRTLGQFGLDFGHVVRESIFTTDMGGLLAANEVRKACFTGGCLPATTAVEVRALAFPGLVVEVAVEARADLDPAAGVRELPGVGA